MSILRKGEYPFTPVMVAGRYELLHEIDSGAHGTVYEANDAELGRRVAVKVLDIGDHDVAMREGQLLAELQHNNVVTIHDHGIGSDYRYFVLELLAGPDLRTWCRGKTPAEIIAKFIEVARGLAAAHAKGLVHRDVKPSNVRICPDGRAVVVDFGLARRIDMLAGDPRERERFAGTLAYAAPECLICEPADAWSDQFSFCVALWEALSGVNPFGGCTRYTTTVARFRAILRGAQGAPRGPRRVVRALRRGLSPRPSDRFPSMLALMAALAPKPRRWTWKALSLAVLVGAGGRHCVPVPQGASFEFIANARARCFGAVAVVAARQGTGDNAVDSLDSAMSAKLSKKTSRDLAMVSEVVAIELEKRVGSSAQIRDTDVLYAWELALLFARDAGDAELRGKAWKQVIALDARLKAQALPR